MDMIYGYMDEVYICREAIYPSQSNADFVRYNALLSNFEIVAGGLALSLALN